MRSASVLLLLASATTAHADRGWHGSVGAGGALVLAGDQGDRLRADVALALKPGSRYGALLAWRAFDDAHRGLVMAGVVYEGAAARPRLVLDLFAQLGADLDAEAPLAGGGVRTTVTLVGPLGVALDAAAFVVIDGVDDSRLHLQSNALVVVRW